MSIRLNVPALHETNWHEFGSRFLFGGTATVITGLIARKFGPSVGGLFLAFPAIFPASASLVEKHERRKKERAGLNGTNRAKDAAAADAYGAGIGTIGLVLFAVVAWWLLPKFPSWAVLSGASLTWLGVSIIIWQICKRLRRA
jgi:hypothetical protein